MDTKLHRVLKAVGDVEEVLLSAPAAGVDVTRYCIRHLS
jgi:hypothetical protein